MFIERILSNFAETCQPGQSFFGLPTWYKYLDDQKDALGRCVPTFDWQNLDSINSLWSIGLAVIEIMLRLGGLIAVGFVIYAGVQYMTSSGEPEKTKNAKNTIINALIGLVIALIAASVVSFIGNSIR